MPATTIPHGADMTRRFVPPRDYTPRVYTGTDVGQQPLNAAALERRRQEILDRHKRLGFTENANLVAVDKQFKSQTIPRRILRDGVFAQD